ncbi:hypothetical protein SLS60_007770 [Paraconiothyrium brasiliense]|uniref:Uncharacterized protein n=1 Tax=Paraconiothyrium brasiliense TaxID=300254 RepID=A0ABR3R2H5_9PLEO
MRGSGGTPGHSESNQRAGHALGDIQSMSFMGSTPQNLPPVGQRPQQSQFESAFGSDTVSSPNAQASHKKLADMTEAERYTLPGLLSMIPMDSPDYSSLAVGQDLTVLGLDLSRPE